MHRRAASAGWAAGMAVGTCVVLLGGPASAQSEPARYDSPLANADPFATPDGDHLPQLLSTPLTSPFQGGDWRTMFVNQGLAGLGMGLPLQLAGAASGGIVASFAHGGAGQGWSPAAVAGASSSWVLAVPLGVAQAGTALNHNGSYGWTVLGGLAGAAVGGGLTVAVLASNDNPGVGTVAILAVGTLVLDLGGSVLGFALSSSGTAAAPSWLRVTPSLSVAMGGETVGISGTF